MDKMQVDAKKKLNDCYFYYYSTCTKGDTCQFRHEPLALGCETMCYHWQQANCFDYQCKYRHMELKKNRKQIPCYWETQPGGCLKKHCPFQHKLRDSIDRIEDKDQESIPQQVVGQPMPTVNQEQANVLAMHNMPAAAAMAHPTFQRPTRRPVVMDPSKIVSVPPAALAVPHNRRPTHDPLLVNLEEESDSESIPSLTPVKKRLMDDSKRTITIKSLEQIRLERIQEEAAAFYQIVPDITIQTDISRVFSDNDNSHSGSERRLSKRYVTMSLDEIHDEINQTPKRERVESGDFKVLSLDEIRASKRRKLDNDVFTTDKSFNNADEDKVNVAKYKLPIKAIDDKALEACLKNIREKSITKNKRLKRHSKVTDKSSPKKPRLVRNRLNNLKSDMSISQLNNNGNISDLHENNNSVLALDSDDLLNDLSDDNDFNDSVILQENVPDVVASCVSSSMVKPSSSKFTNIKNLKLDDNDFLKNLEEFLND